MALRSGAGWDSGGGLEASGSAGWPEVATNAVGFAVAAEAGGASWVQIAANAEGITTIAEWGPALLQQVGITTTLYATTAEICAGGGTAARVVGSVGSTARPRGAGTFPRGA